MKQLSISRISIPRTTRLALFAIALSALSALSAAAIAAAPTGPAGSLSDSATVPKQPVPPPVSAPGTSGAAVSAPSGDAASAAKDTVTAVKIDSAARSNTSDTLSAPNDSAQTKHKYEYTAYPILQVLTWPAEAILVPTVRTLLYPIKPPLRYFLNENVIDRTISLISFGPDEKIMLYPTINLGKETSSYTGLTFRHRALFGNPHERLVAYGNIYVNGDWRFRTYLNSRSMFGSDFSSKIALSLNRYKNSNFTIPDTSNIWTYSDSSNLYSARIGHPLFELFNINGEFEYRDNHFGSAPLPQQGLHSGRDSVAFFRLPDGTYDPRSRGLSDPLSPDRASNNWSARILSVGVERDSRNNENIVLAGSQFSASYHYHFTSNLHDFQGYVAEWTGYFKLGKETYEISPEEERKAGNLSVHKVLEKMEYEKLKHEIVNRKVLVFHTYMAQSFEVPGNRMPVYGLQTLGNDTPLRGYSGSRFRDYAVTGISSEYRFPILHLVDGVMFNEYGIFGRSWDKFYPSVNLRNSWGIRIRVRRPDIFLFTMQLGFHGDEGGLFNMGVDEPF